MTRLLFLIFLFSIKNFDLFSQIKMHCIDSSFRKSYTLTPDSIQIANVKSDNQNSLLFNGSQISSTYSDPKIYNVFGKMNLDGKIVWAKIANSFPTISNYSIKDFANTSNIIYWAGNFADGRYNPFITKTDTSGNILSSWYYTLNYSSGIEFIEIKRIKYIGDDEIYLVARANESGIYSPYNIIMRIRNDGYILWSKIFKTGNGFNTNSGTCTDILKTNFDLYIFGDFQNSSQNNLAGVFCMQLNPSNGALTKISSWSIPLLHEFNMSSYSNNFRIANTTKGFQLFSVVNCGAYAATSSFRNKAVKIRLDSNFVVSNVLQIKPTTFNLNDLALDIDVNKNNQSCILFNNGADYYYCLLNQRDSIEKEKKLILEKNKPLGLDIKGLTYDSIGTIYNLAQYNIPSFNKYELFKLSSNQQISTTDCIGKDTTFTIIQNISFIPYNFYWNAVETTIVQNQILSLTSTSLFSHEEIICNEKSVCDTIKIQGNTRHCLSEQTATFTLYKNPQCLRKTNWVVDTSFIKKMSEPNDTTLIVQFLKPFHGYIKAAFEGCILMDSFYIDVSAPKQFLFLGNDTIFCPGKTITLHAGSGFKTYKWQDNSTDSSFTATEPGLYFVQATDSCDNIFRDTIVLKPMDVVFNLTYSNPVCRYDTASVLLNPQIRNYLWTPSVTGIKLNNILKLFPAATTIYNISGERFTGCTLTDTLLIKVIDCPVYVYVPNAFSPNNDGINDTFKPYISGKLTQYQFSVYNRYGQKIFTTNNYTEGWNGKIKGKFQDPGIFVWTCSYKFLNKETVFKKGTVMLLR